MKMYRRAFLQALGKHIALKHLLDGKIRSEIHDIGESKSRKPFGIVHNFGWIFEIVEINQRLHLVHPAGNIIFHLFRGELLARGAFITRVPDPRREISE